MFRLVLVAVLAGLYGQDFDVASVRLQAPNDVRFFVRSPNRGQFTANGAVAKLLVMLAYDVQDNQVVGGPGWFAAEKWDIQAKSDNDEHNADEQLRHAECLAGFFSSADQNLTHPGGEH